MLSFQSKQSHPNHVTFNRISKFTVVGKRKALEKKAEQVSKTITGPKSKSEAMVECWDISQHSISTIPTRLIKQIHDSKTPLLITNDTMQTPRKKHPQEQFNLIFPLCSDHLITLLQFNALRAMATNRGLLKNSLVTLSDCGSSEDIIAILPYPSNPHLLPSTLLPTTLQQTVPHGEWIDTFPSPEGRDRLIRLAGTFDEDDLWDDCIGGLYQGFPDDEMERRGVVAWSPPWQVSGWEMSEGFFVKWGWLFRGVPGMLEATNRWRGERGEEPLVDVVDDDGDGGGEEVSFT